MLFLQANSDFRKHTQNVVEMKKDLEHIFKRLKIIKQKLNKQMPEAYSSVIGVKTHENVKEEDDEYDIAIKEKKRQGVQPTVSIEEQIEEAEDAKELEI